MANSKSDESLLFLVTGSRGAGKTTFCSALVQAAREAGWKVAGILSPGVYEGTQRTAINAEDLRSGESRRLASRSDDAPTPGSKHWRFDPAVLDWGNQVFQASASSDLLVVDELGPLELERGVGWQAALSAIGDQQYAIGVIVIHAEMLGAALLRWPHANIVEVDTPEDSAHKAQTLARQLF